MILNISKIYCKNCNLSTNLIKIGQCIWYDMYITNIMINIIYIMLFYILS